LPYRVPEVWLFRAAQLKIYSLQNDAYVVQSNSRYFPTINLSEIVRETFQLARERNTSTAVRSLRQNLQKAT
jgi:hypothetical protein